MNREQLKAYVDRYLPEMLKGEGAVTVTGVLLLLVAMFATVNSDALGLEPADGGVVPTATLDGGAVVTVPPTMTLTLVPIETPLATLTIETATATATLDLATGQPVPVPSPSVTGGAYPPPVPTMDPYPGPTPTASLATATPVSERPPIVGLWGDVVCQSGRQEAAVLPSAGYVTELDGELRYIAPIREDSLTGIGPSADHGFETCFVPPVAGVYDIQLQVRAESIDHNSLFVRVDGYESFVWDIPVEGGFSVHSVSARSGSYDGLQVGSDVSPIYVQFYMREPLVDVAWLEIVLR